MQSYCKAPEKTKMKGNSFSEEGEFRNFAV